jgi:hypothetical protein
MTFEIRYQFEFEDGQQASVELELDEETLAQIAPPQTDLPPWTKLSFQQCPSCPLDEAQAPNCPAAVALLQPIAAFTGRFSYEPVAVTVEQPQRKITSNTTSQRALSSLIGLVMATSGCPHLAWFRPMARHHLPFSDAGETTHRAASMYLLAQVLRKRQGLPATLELGGLREIYARVNAVNAAMAGRLHNAHTVDTPVNAVVILDMLALYVPDTLDEQLDAMGVLYAPYLTG